MSDPHHERAPLAPPDRSSERLKAFASWIVVVLLLGFGTYVLVKLTTVHQTEGTYWQTLMREQFPVIVGLPAAGLGALFVTLVLRISTGPLEFEIASLKFKGAAAPIVFWVLGFLSVALAINLLWQSPC